MDQIQIGAFIAACRKEQKLTQAQLAEKLNITDRAVSKWETGKCMPDSSIMPELCEILGITVNELFCGEKADAECPENYEKKTSESLIVLKQKEENSIKKHLLVSVLFSVVLLIGILVCFICDLSIAGSLTWSLIPISSIILAWVVLFPGMLSRKKAVAASFLSLSVFINPYLYLLSRLVQVRAVFTVGSVTAVISLIFLWLIYGVFRRFGTTRKFFSMGITFLAAILLMLIIDMTLHKMLPQIMAGPVFDIWDMPAAFLLLVLAISSFLYDYARRQGRGC